MKEEILFDLDILLGNWESVNLHPTVMVYKTDIAYIQISGKILYRQSDILKLLEDNYEKSWRED